MDVSPSRLEICKSGDGQLENRDSPIHLDQEDMRCIGVLPEPEDQIESALLETDTTIQQQLVVGILESVLGVGFLGVRSGVLL